VTDNGGTHTRPPGSQAPRRHPMVRMVRNRVAAGVLTLFVASIVVFCATEVLPGNAASAILGPHATRESTLALERRLNLTGNIVGRYIHWLKSVLTGHLGRSLANNQPVWHYVQPRFVNSAVLIVVAGLLGTLIGVMLGIVAAVRKDGLLDQSASVFLLVATSLPEFVIAAVVVILFATLVFQWFPPASVLAAGTYAWQSPKLLVLPVLTLVIVIVPYIFRMSRASMIEALDSEYCEMARLQGLKPWRLALQHALPNAVPPSVQVVGLSFLYLAGGIVVVEDVFNFPGVGQGLVNAVTDRDIPVIQVIVLVLAAFYVLVNITTDVIALYATPRRRLPRA
jgi:peptide/nickel transport system permease protein